MAKATRSTTGVSTRETAVNNSTLAGTRNLLTFRRPFDLAQEMDRAALRAELERAAKIRPGSAPLRMPDDDGVYHLFYVPDPGEEKPFPVLFPAQWVPAMLFGAACMEGHEVAREFAYTSTMLPLDPEPGPAGGGS